MAVVSAQPAREPLRCPSAQADMPGARILGVLSGEGPARLTYLREPVAPTPEILSYAAPVPPNEVFRFSAHCEEAKCVHFAGQRCQLAERIVDMMPEVADSLPPCIIRRTCRWHRQEGRAACVRCPQIMTSNPGADEDLRRVAGMPPAESA